MAKRGAAVWPDIPRLLKARAHFRQLSAESASSVPAFLAWKAFMVSTRAESGDTEKAKCSAAIAANLRAFPDPLSASTRSFVAALNGFRSGGSRVVVGEWYLRPDEWDQMSRSAIAERTDEVIRRISRLNDHVDRLRNRDLFLAAAELAFHAYNVRNAVLAHVAVLSTGELFGAIVPAFEELAALHAVAGLARRGDMTFGDAAESTGVIG